MILASVILRKRDSNGIAITTGQLESLQSLRRCWIRIRPKKTQRIGHSGPVTPQLGSTVVNSNRKQRNNVKEKEGADGKHKNMRQGRRRVSFSRTDLDLRGRGAEKK